jgi:intracellular sulfur oxidation DsrE/DsrF family protein
MENQTMRTIHKLLAGLALIGLFAGPVAAMAADSTGSDSHPFAKYHYVIQVSEDNPGVWTLAMNNAQNLLNYYGPSDVQVVIVAYGPGLKMLLKNSKVASRVQSVAMEGVEFDACHNTMEHMAKKLGHMPAINSAATVVPAGVVRIGQLEGKGFAYIKP